MPTTNLIVAVTVFAAVAALAGAVMFWLRDMGKTAAEERLAQLTGKKPDGLGRDGRANWRVPCSRSWTRFVWRTMAASCFARSLA